MHVQAAIGTGPVDAAYKAIDAIVQAPNTLLEFAVHAVTEGIDALGEVTVRIESTNGYCRLTAQNRNGRTPHLRRPRRRHRHHRRQRQGLPHRAQQAARRHRQVWAGRNACHQLNALVHRKEETMATVTPTRNSIFALIWHESFPETRTLPGGWDLSDLPRNGRLPDSGYGASVATVADALAADCLNGSPIRSRN